jgi:Fe-S-cluster containining protein
LNLPGSVLNVQKKQLRIMLNNCLQHQSQLADIDRDFRCPDDCSAPGCRKAGIIVEVTLFDLIGLGRFLNTPVSELFSQNCHLGLMVRKTNVNYMNLLIKIEKPCLFLSGTQCEVHNVKPLSCQLFPELYHIQGALPEVSKKPIFHSFPCLKKPIVVSEKRKKALKKLERKSLPEQALSCAYLFGIPKFIIDKKHLRKKDRRDQSKHRVPSLQDYDNLLMKLLKSNRFNENVTEKIYRLDAESEVKNLFEKLKDHVRMEDLMEKMVCSTVVHRLEKDNIKQLKRSLLPSATCFMQINTLGNYH